MAVERPTTTQSMGRAQTPRPSTRCSTARSSLSSSRRRRTETGATNRSRPQKTLRSSVCGRADRSQAEARARASARVAVPPPRGRVAAPPRGATRIFRGGLPTRRAKPARPRARGPGSSRARGSRRRPRGGRVAAAPRGRDISEGIEKRRAKNAAAETTGGARRRRTPKKKQASTPALASAASQRREQLTGPISGAPRTPGDQSVNRSASRAGSKLRGAFKGCSLFVRRVERTCS